MNRYIGDGMRDSGEELPPSFDAFLAEALACGSDETLVREWHPDSVTPIHSHPFDAEAVVVRGEMWLSEGTRTRHLEQGGTFRLSAGISHSERYGAEGATLWVARRQVAE